jgi:hypothetical protein
MFKALLLQVIFASRLYGWALVLGCSQTLYFSRQTTVCEQATLMQAFTRKHLTSLVSLPTSRQQVVFALLVPCCQQVWNNLLTVVTTLLIFSNLLQGCSNKSDTVMI